MTQIRGTVNYVYSLDDLLGRGATCQVYKGVNKRDGEVRALKVFDPRVDALFRREIEALKYLKHQNIVQYYGCEEEVTSRRIVAIVEYCERGSLHSLLIEPENVKGIADDEFLRLLRHMAAGLRYIRHKGFVHRDIKPGNILLKIDEDGNNIYKLTDFGTAKAMDDDERFQSLVGTEEYLHPDIFKAAFIEPHKSHRFDITVDLWSLGATLFHAATGNVPFRPHGGRSDRAMMFNLLSKKDKGVISGVQAEESGEVIWSKTLPQNCRLSSGLKMYVTDILANLLEKAANRSWGFDQFFAAVNELCLQTPVHMFSTVQATHHILYMERNATFSDLQHEIHSHTSIAPADQCLMYDEEVLLDMVSSENPTTAAEPIILMFSKLSTDRQKSALSAYPIEVSIKFPESVRYDHDHRQARHTCEALADLMYITSSALSAMVILNKTMRKWRLLMQAAVRRYMVELSSLRDRINDIVTMLSHMAPPDTTSVDQQSRSTNSSCNIEQIQRVLKMCESMIQNAEEKNESVIPTLMPKEAVTHQKRLSRIFDNSKVFVKKFYERRQHRHLPYHEKQLHEFDRQKLEGDYFKAVGIWSDQVLPALENSHTAFLEWHRNHLENIQQSVEHVHGEMQEIKESISHMVKTGTVIVGKSEPEHSNLIISGPCSLPYSFTKALHNLSSSTSDCTSLVNSGKEEMKRLIDQCKNLPSPEEC